jgi:putative phosphoesterase
MRICILSDSHDRGPMMAAAVSAAAAEGAEAVIHCGDIIGGNTLRASLKLGLPIHAVHGNNLGDPVSIARIAHNSDEQLHYYGQDATLKLGGRRIFLTHYPHIGHGMACTGDYDLVCCGHSHETEVRQQPNIKGGTDLAGQSRHRRRSGCAICNLDPGRPGGLELRNSPADQRGDAGLSGCRASHNCCSAFSFSIETLEDCTGAFGDQPLKSQA